VPPTDTISNEKRAHLIGTPQCSMCAPGALLHRGHGRSAFLYAQPGHQTALRDLCSVNPARQ